jgi:BlaI family transcriptional regulator, penicillinase repressor
MAKRLSRLEFRIMDLLWRLGTSSVREVQEGLPEKGRPAYNTVQTILARLEAKDAVRRARKISNAHTCQPVITRAATQRLLVAEPPASCGGRAVSLVSHLIETGQLTPHEVQEARKALKKGREHD